MLEKVNKGIDIVEEKGIRNTSLYLRNFNINVEDYETKVLLEESIENILKPQVIYEDGKEVLFFDVSGTISLEEYLKSNKIKKDILCKILITVDNTLANIENYLISENSLLLDAKAIRIIKNGQNIKLKFIVVPNYNSDFSYELSKFILKLLRFIDIDDKEALTLAYGLFVRSSKENYTLSDLMELIDIVKGKDTSYFLDENELYEHDVKLAEEISDELINENVFEKTFYEEYSEPKEKVELKKPRIEFKNKKDEVENEKFDDIITNTMGIEDDEKVLSMDSETKNIINDNIFESLDEDNKVINFKKPKFNFKFKKAFSGHINLSLLKITIMPLAIIAVPFILYLIYGLNGFKKIMPTVCIYEIAFMMIFMISIFRDNKNNK